MRRILISHEVWLAEGRGGLEGVLILKAEPDHLLIWSIATAPSVREAVSAIGCWSPRRCGRASLGKLRAPLYRRAVDGQHRLVRTARVRARADRATRRPPHRSLGQSAGLGTPMHILITGAAGMIGRKLTERLIMDRALDSKPIDKFTLIDIVAPARPAGFSDHVKTRAADLAEPGVADKAIAERPEVIFHLAGVVSGEAELDFEKGYRVNLDGTRALLEAIRKAGDGYKPRRGVHVVDRGVRRAVPGRHFRRVSSDAADLLRHAEGDLRSCCSPTTRGAASATASASACRPSWCGRASRTRRLPASSPASSASRLPARRRCCRLPRPSCTPTPARARRWAF